MRGDWICVDKGEFPAVVVLSSIERTSAMRELVWRSQADVAKAFGVSETAVQKWLARGMPGRKGSYPVAEICVWYRERCEQRLIAKLEAHLGITRNGEVL